jgi:DNA repair photolyase
MSTPLKGRGTALAPPNRFARQHAEDVDDGWPQDPDEFLGAPGAPRTEIHPDKAKRVLTTNNSPDIFFEQSLNPYQGCEHGCIYCYARPSHAYQGLSAGLDFETRIFAKHDAAKLLEAELANPRYQCKPIMLGANTDPWQPIERGLRITRAVLEVLVSTRHPVHVITKGAGVLRDIDLLADLARDGLASAFVSLPTLDDGLKRVLEPRAASPGARLRIIEALSNAGVPVGVMVAPVIPVLTDRELESILEAAHTAGAQRAAYIMLRLPFEVKDLFRDWLAQHFPLTAAHVMSQVQDMRGGRDNDPEFGSRMSGRGAVAELTKKRFEVACRRLGLATGRGTSLTTQLFVRPYAVTPQMSLW